MTHARFWNYVRKGEGCWLWLAAISSAGYGQATINGRQEGAHRVAWELRRGPIPPGLFVLHRCDVRHCVNPDHLFLGTAGDNIRDAVRKGRFFSPKPALRRITDAQAEEIQAAYRRGLRRGEGAAFARRFAIHTSCVTDIGHGRTYRFPVGTTADQMAAIGLQDGLNGERRG